MRQRSSEEAVRKLVPACHLDRNQLGELQAQYAGKGWPAKRGCIARRLMRARPPPPPKAERLVLEAMEIGDEPAPRDPPPRPSFACHHRSTFQTCPVRFSSASGWLHFKFRFAMQGPRLAHFLRVALTGVDKHITQASEFDRLALCEWEATLGYEGLHFVYSDDGGVKPEWPMKALMDVCNRVGRRFVTGGPGAALCNVKQRLPSAAASDSPKPAPANAGAKET